MKIYTLEYYDPDWGDYGKTDLVDQDYWWSDRDFVQAIVDWKNAELVNAKQRALDKEYDKELGIYERKMRQAKILNDAGENVFSDYKEPERRIYTVHKWSPWYSIVEAYLDEIR